MAEFFAVQAFEITDQLLRFPESGRVVPEIGREDVREVFLHSYRIIYRLRGGGVEILTVHHGARRFPEVR